ncbi:hypothetical protein A3H85_01900 [Candidatus Daviesbacteria bacterium RIFCSPLOWO2_02_FULL_40_8]|uniref:Trigger factor n=1 Tax=Candidatus Daviesbacteria bacterium RIFCSPLOWO2_01_FULL_40_24 TaxID=1797787 RepID=A0A1F5MJS0_9BACT|nr:MAG: hypothetical protein A2780_02705 [Candidatus Daviesbacteria bacterium RIFCSPHIGHO2_01_FULL_41_45]OGE35450.1 MAG: hypothetical protein A3C32_03280 [Candidatus Daviesbacteria bacterium RIFCSPHIGHO2_02_FULL_41_14]OGE65540.1 MAG: hypothetical protein A3B49_01860 [Candidatus Daviesbacteria bacterium RIFCSPLOWO2_01_FULL_40_24]OGE67102.1 MAG: hypothetical protein A3H85_01900 [Candidatus Daviesbacteria bacterium RIFCSPLOWO2_02_FULL_40_8]
MITKNITNLPKSVVEVAITVPWEDISAKWDETLTRLSQEVEIPGFRKGQAPLNMVENSIGNKLQDEFLKVVMPQMLVESLQGSTVVPINYPKYQLTSFFKGQSLIFTAQVTNRPEVKISGDYKGLKVQRPELKVIGDTDKDKVIEDLFKRWKVKNPVAQSSQNGVTSGSVSFNQPQASTPQPVISDIPDDAFAKSMGAQSLEDLTLKIKTDLEAEAKYNNELDYEEALLQEVEKITQVDIPDVLVEDELNRMMVSLQRRVSDMGMLMDDYLRSQNETSEGIKNKWRPQAEKNVRMELGLAEVARLENVVISDEEVQAEIDKIQDARLKSQFESQEPRLHLKHNLRQIKTLDLLKKLLKPA